MPNRAFYSILSYLKTWEQLDILKYLFEINSKIEKVNYRIGRLREFYENISKGDEMNKVNVWQFINEQVKVQFIDGDEITGWFVKDKYNERKFSILYLNDAKVISFNKSDIKSITWLSNNVVVKYDEIKFDE